MLKPKTSPAPVVEDDELDDEDEAKYDDETPLFEQEDQGR